MGTPEVRTQCNISQTIYSTGEAKLVPSTAWDNNRFVTLLLSVRSQASQLNDCRALARAFLGIY